MSIFLIGRRLRAPELHVRQHCMKAALLILSLSLLSSVSSADPTLSGKWQSDRDLTMAFIKKNVRLEPKTECFLSQMMGRLTLTFTDQSVRSSLPDWTASVEGKKHKMVGFNEEHPYKVVFTGANTVVVSEVEAVTGHPVATTYNFVSPDVMWVYTGGADAALPDSHYREYFKRVR